MPRKRCDDDLIKSAVRLKKAGAFDKDIAAAVGVHVATFSKWVNHPETAKQRELGEALKKTEAEYKNALLAIIARDAKERDWKAAAWILERKYPAEFSRRTGFVDADGEGVTPTFYFDPNDA